MNLTVLFAVLTLIVSALVIATGIFSGRQLEAKDIQIAFYKNQTSLWRNATGILCDAYDYRVIDINFLIESYKLPQNLTLGLNCTQLMETIR